jgi:hypothetical protein
MSKLNFASVSEAYSIGSEQIKNTQSEIARLKKIIEDSSTNTSGIKKESITQNNEYKRIGNPDNVQAQFCSSNNSNNNTNPYNPMNSNNPMNQNNPIFNDVISSDEFDYTFLKIMRHPKFDEIVKNYIIIKHPDWILNNTHYIPSSVPQRNIESSPTTPMMVMSSSSAGNYQPPSNQYLLSKEYFGYNNALTKNYVIFFIVAMLIYLGICLVIKK